MTSTTTSGSTGKSIRKDTVKIEMYDYMTPVWAREKDSDVWALYKCIGLYGTHPSGSSANVLTYQVVALHADSDGEFFMFTNVERPCIGDDVVVHKDGRAVKAILEAIGKNGIRVRTNDGGAMSIDFSWFPDSFRITRM